jgi:hypothetical protein
VSRADPYHVAALSMGFSLWDALCVAWESMLADFNSSVTATDAQSANMHGMGGNIGKDWQTPQEAKTGTWQFAREAQNLANAFHAVQDLARHGGKSMERYGKNVIQTLWHGILDFFGFDKLDEAYQNTKEIYQERQDPGKNDPGPSNNEGPSFDERDDWC